MCCWVTLGLLTLFRSLQTTRCVLWPAGSYGLPKSTSGCPLSDGFQWKTGWRFQDTNDKFSNGIKSEEFHLDGEVDIKKVNRSFCIKTNTAEDVHETNRPSWPSGKYCVYKKDTQCPAGLTNGFVFWDDDNYGNLNKKGGILPSGVYDSNTKIQFCCATDGVKSRPILLPTEVPFFLLAHASKECQMVKWAIATQEWIHFDTHSWWKGDDRRWPYPYNAGENHPQIYYCYYRGCNKTLNGVKGTLHSPNYPRNYPDGQYCSWRITVNPMQQIHLTFTEFHLESENNTDVLYVYDAQNATGEVLGVFYGDNPPPKNGINSTTNSMFLIFKSDDTGSGVFGIGFNASYHAVNNSAVPTFTTTAIPTQDITSTTSKTSLYSSSKTTFDMGATSTTDRTRSGEKDQRQQSQGKGLNVVAVVVPLVALIFLAALLLAGFAFHKRRRAKKQEQGRSKEVVFSRSNVEQPVSLENPYYDSKLVKVQNELYSNVREDYRIDKETCDQNHSENLLSGESEVYSNATEDYDGDKERYKQQENELYTEFEEDYMTDKGTFKDQESENPLYESAGPDVVPHPIYD